MSCKYKTLILGDIMTIRNDWVAHLMRYPLKELRQRQNIVKQQQQTAYRAKNTHALEELQDMEDSLTEAVYLKEFSYRYRDGFVIVFMS